jgi:cephalosporin-C deacetylase-like acetyl esterase/lysophospholipase L1-like esterase
MPCSGPQKTITPICLLILASLSLPLACTAEEIRFTPRNPTGIYAIGEKVSWTVTLPKGPATRPDRYQLSIRKNNSEVIQTGELDLSSGTATIETFLNEPGMIYTELTPLSLPASQLPPPGVMVRSPIIAAGAAVAPTELLPSVPCPKDFDQFWKSNIDLLERIPPNVQLTPADSGDPSIEYSIIRMDNFNGSHIWGQLARPKLITPKREGKFPALVVFQWAGGPYPLEKQWATDHAKQGFLTLNIEPHDVPPNMPKAWYKTLPQRIKSYQTIGNDDRDRSYFLQMYLADYRAVDYLASRPDWDGKILAVIGTSMGGQQSLCVAGLHPKITHVMVEEPSGCDTNGPLHSRRSGYPNFPSDNPKIMQAALYFDPVNFASRIKAKCLVSMGFVDTTAPPVGVWIAYNQIKSPKEVVPMIDAPHNNFASDMEQKPWYQRSYKWLTTLAAGNDVLTSGHASIPSERTDANSRIAHQQLLQKAKAGGIDIYFAGDSITRRWGCSDTQYAAFLQNWKQNFFGWNAADFGWGGDTVQNILWRLENGELDGINPKIIVLLAGTNNIGKAPADEAKIADISAGMKKVVEVMRAKAPNATIILTGIFPRSDNLQAYPAITAINQNLANMADGNKTRYININDKLASPDGKLFDGMSLDGLHPTLKAYQIWADALKPIFTEILGPTAETDHAPPPTGDPSNAHPK